jgi:hypothetical protein
MPTLFAVVANPIFNKHEVWVRKDPGCRFEIDAVFLRVGPVLGRVPFEAHLLYTSYHGLVGSRFGCQNADPISTHNSETAIARRLIQWAAVISVPPS